MGDVDWQSAVRKNNLTHSFSKVNIQKVLIE